ncbi:adenine-specific DNA-methyltransferase [Paenacidovorax caeni]|uniref:Adenine-specific DNA-methyltransferase n=1 Tax=Paenacidovorax caeni TaxID=343013 RepID=A0A1I7FFU8_9BURK|nr:site-specific DNA-methyltransferase [Paenacidovorax caeni]SFU35049.1 adenine-specific DNA-methyltransferase [Paenacidovorax caeni]
MPTLDWLNRATAFSTAAQVPYRLLDTVSTHGNQHQAHDNLLIQGDNLEALKALLPFYRGQVKCIFIDPPYNTQSAFEHYDDNLEHSQWLSMMLPRLQLLRELLAEDGSIWVTIDDNEGHYLKVLMDEVFGRRNFVANVFWQKTHTRENRTDISAVHDHLLVMAKNRDGWKEVRNMLPSSEEQLERFTNPDSDPRGNWASLPAHAKAEKGRREAQFFTITTPSGRKIDPPPGRCWLYTEPRFLEMVRDGRIWFGESGNNAPRVKKFLSEVQEGLVPSTLWLHQEVGTNGKAKAELVALFPGETPFSTPKPEALLQRILHIASNPGDLVLDSFLGSGTTAAVAHKMGRRWIGIEMGEHAATHCLPRLEKVIAGEQGGISSAVNWQGGGGFRFARLGAPIFDAHGCIHPDVRFATLAAFVWQQETGTAFDPALGRAGTPWLGTHSVFESCSRLSDKAEVPISLEISDAPVLRSRTAYYLLFNGILGDKRPASGNVLTRAVLDALLALHATTPHPEAPLVVYGEANRLGPETLARARVTFKHIPYDVKAR